MGSRVPLLHQVLIIDAIVLSFQNVASVSLLILLHRASEKREADINLRMDIIMRLKAADLHPLVLLNRSKTAVYILVSASAERLETEAENSSFLKPLRGQAGLAPYTKRNRHLFGHTVSLMRGYLVHLLGLKVSFTCRCYRTIFSPRASVNGSQCALCNAASGIAEPASILEP